MRLKILRKERPAFENEGVVISGNRIDLSNIDCKPAKHCKNHTFNSPRSFNNEFSPFHIPRFDSTYEMNIHSTKQIPIHRKLLLPSPTESTYLSSYQAIEATYLEHGIRINLNPPTDAGLIKRQHQTTENSPGRNSGNNTERYKTFNNRNLSRSSTPPHYLTTVQDTNLNSRTSVAAPEQMHTHKISYAQSSDNDHCSSVIAASVHADQMTVPTQSDITNDKPSLATLIGNDPDLIYMSSLLRKTSEDSFRDTIRRQSGLRRTSVIHRHPPLRTTANSNHHEKSLSTTDHPHSSLRTSTRVVTPPITSSLSQKLEKDIIKHASRIRLTQSNYSFTRQESSSKSHTTKNMSTSSNSSASMNHPKKQNRTTVKSSKSMSLEPLELLLTPAHHPLPSVGPSRATSLSSNDSPTTIRNNYKKDKKRTKSHAISVADNNKNVHNDVPSFISNEHAKSTLLNDESLSSVKTSPRIKIAHDKTPQSNSSDSGCYDRSSNSSGDTLSVMSLSINQALSSLPSARLTSASTRRSNTNKKVSFEDQSFTVIITTSTYV